jgi:hypothetical protein
VSRPFQLDQPAEQLPVVTGEPGAGGEGAIEGVVEGFRVRLGRIEGRSGILPVRFQPLEQVTRGSVSSTKVATGGRGPSVG